MKKVISLMLALVLALSLTACGGKSSGPEGVVGRFCKGLQELDEEAIAQCFENGDDLELSACRPLLYGRIWVNWPTNGVVSV